MTTHNQSESAILPILQEDYANRRQTKHPGRWRTFVLAIVHLLILLHIAHYLLFRRTLSPLEPSETMYALELGYVNAGTIFFVLAILSTVIFGRFFCGWACHLVALQDLAGALLRRLGYRPLPLRSRLLGLIPYVLAAYMFMLPTMQRFWSRRPHPGFSNHLLTGDFWATFPTPVIGILTLIICGFVAVYLLGNKGFCRYVCPYGALFGVADQFAFGRIRVTDACHQCGKCTAVCTSDIRVHEQVAQSAMITDPNCMKCLDCIASCPTGALYYSLDWIAPAPTDVRRSNKTAIHRTYDFSLTEEVGALAACAITIYALRGLYDGPPLLLAVTAGAMTGYFSICVVRVLFKTEARLQRIVLRQNGALTPVGRWIIALSIAWLCFLAHSTFMQGCRQYGRHCLDQIPVSWTDLLNESSDGIRSRQLDMDIVTSANRSFEIADRFGLVEIVEVKLGLAWTSLVLGNRAVAQDYIQTAYRMQPDSELIRDMRDQLDASR